MSINTSYATSGGYYLLPQQSNNTASANSKAATQTTSATTTNNSLAAYLLDLSPDAQNYLNGLSDPSTHNSNASFVLTDAQQQKLTSILDKYKGQPYTQDTFNHIQMDLQQAGLSPDQLAQQQKMKDFNTTIVLLDALNGKSSSPLQDDTTDYDSQKTNYIQQIGQQFQALAAQVSA